jgi:hypothetical protein
MLVTLANGRAIALTPKELVQINRGNAISFRRPRDPVLKFQVQKIRNYTELCFAVLVRNMQLSGFDGNEYTQQEAINALTREGVETSQFHKLLGVERGKTMRLSGRSVQALQHAGAALVYNDRHITVGAGGYYEEFGKAVPICGEIPLLQGKPAKAWYRLKTSGEDPEPW